MARYTYGDSGLAGERLAVVAEMFESTSRSFLRANVSRAPDVALDIGCGPGHSTGMVAATTGARLTVGIDRSESFIRVARAGASAGRAFLVGDAAVPPLPVRAADLVYARLLLAHLTDPASVVAQWSSILARRGVVLVDDLESIETSEEVFRTYLDEVALAVVRAQGGALFVGPVLRSAPDPPGTERVHDAMATFTPDASVTARIFAMNLEVLVGRGETLPRPDIAEELAAIVDRRRRVEAVRWSVAQLAWRRTR